jgi:hypothetical protein
MVPVPRGASWEELNTRLLEQCQKRRQERLRGQEQTIGERFEKDRAALLPLPMTPYEACDKRPGRVSSLSLVRYRCNDYSVPVCWGYREVLVKGYVDEVVISCGAEVIARHRRSYEREDMIFDPLHYLALLEQKTNALDQAAPLVVGSCPRSSPNCGDCWKHGCRNEASGNTCRCCGCWRWRRSAKPSKTRYG